MTTETVARLAQIFGALVILLQWRRFRRLWHQTATVSTFVAAASLCIGFSFGILLKILAWLSMPALPRQTESLVIILDVMALVGLIVLAINAFLQGDDEDEMASQ